MRVRFTIGDTAIDSEWLDTPTARDLYAALPLETSGSYWGGEFYFETPVNAKTESGASDVVDRGAAAYWPPGRCLCLFWGPTPVSQGQECRAADAVNVIGQVDDPEALQSLHGRHVRVEPIDE